MRKRIYLAGPYIQGDVAANVHKAIDVWHDLWIEGFAPFCPHLSHFLHLQEQLLYEEWLEFDLEWLPLCHAVFRIHGESKGADRECAKAKELGIPVFYYLDELLLWGKQLDTMDKEIEKALLGTTNPQGVKLQCGQ